jgi:sugar diacid utilization regulator
MGQTYGWNLEGCFIPVLVQDNTSIILPPDVIKADLNSDTLLLFPLMRQEEIQSRTAEIITILQADRTVRVGIGRAIESIMELPKGFAQARQAINIGRQAKWPQCVICYNDLGVYRVLYSGVDNAEKQLFINDFLGPILNEGELITTLRVYFENRGNRRSTAHAMGVHYNTVSYRITHIEQLTKKNLNNPDDCLCLQVAVKLLDMASL